MATEPGSPHRPNEDFAGATPTAVVLLDGAGVPAEVDVGCRHGVAWFVRQLGTRLLAEMMTTSPLENCLASAITFTAAEHSGVCDPHGQGAPAATVIAVRAGQEQLDYLVLADSTLLLATDDEVHAITDDREETTGKTYRTAMDATPNGSPEHEGARTEYIRSMQEHRNRDGGFWVAAGDPRAAGEAITGSVAICDLRSVALLSDGATRLVDRFGQLTWTYVVGLLQDPDGPTELIRRTREAEISDSQGRRWPRGKAFDDATVAVVLGLSVGRS